MYSLQPQTRSHLSTRHSSGRTGDERLTAIDPFVDRVSEIPPDVAPTSTRGVVTTTGTQLRTSSSTGGCESVRTVFSETIRPHSVEDTEETEPLVETIRNELTDTIAIALAPRSKTTFSEDLKEGILSEAETRKIESEIMRRALGREAAFLEDAHETAGAIVSWIETADETPLVDLGFERLQDRRETLTAHRERCEELAVDRQSFLGKTTGRSGEIGLRHRDLVSSLYGSPIDHPVSTVARLERTCLECQRAVRDHLTQRV